MIKTIKLKITLIFFHLRKLDFLETRGDFSSTRSRARGEGSVGGDSHINLPEITGIIDFSEITCLVFILMKMSAVFSSL